MKKEEKQEIALMVEAGIMPKIRAEFSTKQEFISFEERIDRKFGVLWENIEDKFKMVFEAFNLVFKKLDQHDQMFAEINTKLENKAETKEVDALERRVTVLERKHRPSGA